MASYFHAYPFHTRHHVFRLFAVICPLTARYYFPRQLLIPHFWTPAQQVAFRGVYHSLRAEHHLPVLQGMQKTSSRVKDRQLQSHLKDLCAKVSQSIFSFSLTVFINSLLCFILFLLFQGFWFSISYSLMLCFYSFHVCRKYLSMNLCLFCLHLWPSNDYFCSPLRPFQSSVFNSNTKKMKP